MKEKEENHRSPEHQLHAIVIAQLQKLGEGLFKCGYFSGWIQVDKHNNGYEVMWCTGKTTHHPLFGPAISVSYTNNGIGDVFKSVISMWPVDDQGEVNYWAEWLSKKINKAVKRNVL